MSQTNNSQLAAELPGGENNGPILEGRELEKFYAQPDGGRIEVISPTNNQNHAGENSGAAGAIGLRQIDAAADADRTGGKAFEIVLNFRVSVDENEGVVKVQNSRAVIFAPRSGQSELEDRSSETRTARGKAFEAVLIFRVAASSRVSAGRRV